MGTRPVSLPLAADDIIEFHAARLLLLLSICGVAGRIDGLTKMAKLDFFVRYPDFFEAARAATVPGAATPASVSSDADDAVESAMVRHHYGPWDKRYYHVLAYLEARRLITVAKEKNSFRITLTDLGRERAKALVARPSFVPLAERMSQVKKTFGSKNGTFLKNLIYRLFDQEVGKRPMGETIQ
jgi:hypothetical protein